jgi:hypothetical protein
MLIPSFRCQFNEIAFEWMDEGVTRFLPATSTPVLPNMRRDRRFLAAGRFDVLEVMPFGRFVVSSRRRSILAPL